jgi:hypothetical protein
MYSYTLNIAVARYPLDQEFGIISAVFSNMLDAPGPTLSIDLQSGYQLQQSMIVSAAVISIVILYTCIHDTSRVSDKALCEKERSSIERLSFKLQQEADCCSI